MAERSFAEEVGKLKLRPGETFRGEGILAVTKALLQSGVAYVGGYQGAPISHLMDVLSDAQGILSELGVHFEASANEGAAAAMLAASVNYPLRGAVTWKSTAGTNVASDALANVASSGVKGGALVVIGEDYGEGSSIMQERTHAFAMKSQMWLLDPRPNLPSIVAAVERGFELSEASNTPVMLELRIRACHVYGSFIAAANRPPPFTLKEAMENPARDYSRVVLPPSNFKHEVEKIERRWPAAIDYIKRARLNEFFGGHRGDVGIVVQGGLYNTLMRSLERLGLADEFGGTETPIYCLNVAYPLIEDEVKGFCLDKRAVLMVEEGQPEYIEQSFNTILRNADIETKVIGKRLLPRAGEYTSQVLIDGVRSILREFQSSGARSGRSRLPGHPPPPSGGGVEPRSGKTEAAKTVAFDDPPSGPPCGPPPPQAGEDGPSAATEPDPLKKLAAIVPQRPAGFCIGCPERPVFSAMKLLEKEIGKFHVSCDIGCHLFSILPPFDIGNTTMGYGLGWSGAAAFAAPSSKRTLAVMGDGGFWHNGLASGVGGAVFNRNDNVLVIIDNGYSAATGGQDVPSSRADNETKATQNPIAKAVRGVGVEWIREVNTYDVGAMKRALKDAMTTAFKGPKVVIAQSECMLNRQRRERPARERAIKDGRRVIRPRYGVDPDTCTGDHACIRLSGCPSLTLKDNPDPLRQDPVAWIDQDCVGCGVCGANAHAAILCPSFYRADLIYNPSRLDRIAGWVRGAVIGWLQRLLRSDGSRSSLMQGLNAALLGESRVPEDAEPLAADRVWVPGAGKSGRSRSHASGERSQFDGGEGRAVDPRPIKIVIAALGGQGGGVLSDWIVAAGERSGFIAQATSVPGVAQRTGATVYYIELFPEAAARARGKAPVLALMPTPGDVDIVIAAELMEAGRAILRGFVSRETTLIASSHRDYAIEEKVALGEGRKDQTAVVSAARARAGRLILADMALAAQAANAPLSAVLFGALAGSGALPWTQDVFERTIHEGRSADSNFRGFGAGMRTAETTADPASAKTLLPRERRSHRKESDAASGTHPLRLAGEDDEASAEPPDGVDSHPFSDSLTPNHSPASAREETARHVQSRKRTDRTRRLNERLSHFRAGTQALLHEGLKRVADYQDARYGAVYLDRMEAVARLDDAAGGARAGWRLTAAVARHLALWMTYEDAIRVADLKTRASRFARVSADVKAAPGQIVLVSEYFHPRTEEICDLLPPRLAHAILKSRRARAALSALLGGGRRISTTKLRGFLPLYLLALLRPTRRGSHRFRAETKRISAWLSLIEGEAAKDYALACEIAALQRLLKGYGDTYERGLASFKRIVAALDQVRSAPRPAAALAGLADAALKDEEGAALEAALAQLEGKSVEPAVQQRQMK
jgi:indolepyruvate ferredoxin oxidoreductase alpha subunit